MSNSKMNFLLILVLITYSCTICVRTEFQMDHAGHYRLPNHTIPTHYDITLRTEVARFNMQFTGHSIINITVLQETDTLMFHACNLIFDESQTSLYNEDQQTIVPVIKHGYNQERDFTILHFESTLRAGRYVLSLKFIGAMHDRSNRFFRTYYLDNQREQRLLGATHFEPTSARYAFPCWDEPALKATFDISIQHDKNYTAISNMPILFKTYAGDMIETKFRTSPIMSTYVVAFVISDFEYVTNEYKNFTVWTWKDKIQEAVYARDIGQVILRELEEFTGIPFVLPKLDQISIPGFSAGMENFGLIVYRPQELFCTDKSSESVKLSVTSMITHEFAHQWFGNLVTPAWWEYAWLSEGFATYFEYYIPNKINASWKTMDQLFITEQLQNAFWIDAGRSRPMSQSAGSPEEIGSLFDFITYSKAGCIVRMMSHTLTDEVFQKGLRMYLRSRSFTYATPDHLFNSLQRAADESLLFPKTFSVERIMNTWIQQAGYPVIDVMRDYETSSVIIKQERFLLAPLGEEHTRNHKWYIPITYATQEDLNFNNTFTHIILEPNDQSTNLPIDLHPTSWIIINVQGTGYYRVNYDMENWLLIAKYLQTEEFTNIHKLNRAQLIDDAWKMAGTGRLDYSIALEITDYLRQEHEYELWTIALSNFKLINQMLVHTKYKHSFQTYITGMMNNLTDTIKYEEQLDESYINSYTRSHVIDWDCAVGVRGCRSFAREKLKQWLSNQTDDLNESSIDVMMATLCGGLREADQETWNAVRKRYSDSTSQENTIIMAALGCSLSDKILTNYLNMSLDPNTSIELNLVINAIQENNPRMVEVILNFMLNNIAVIQTNYHWPVLLYQLSKNVFTVEQLSLMNSLVTNLNSSGRNMSLDITKLIDNVMKSQEHTKSIGQWLERRGLFSDCSSR